MAAPLKNLIAFSSNPIGQRLKLEMKKRDLTSAELAKRAGVKTSFIYDVISGKSTNPSTIKLAQVAKVLELSLNYLAGNAENKAANDDHDYVTIPRITLDLSKSSGNVVSWEQEGEPCYFSKAWIKDHLNAKVEDMRLLYVQGDSMAPALCNNDLIMIDTARKHPTPPGIFVLFDGVGLVTKRLEFIARSKSPHIRVMSDNPQYAAYERSIEETFIIGRVVWFGRAI